MRTKANGRISQQRSENVIAWLLPQVNRNCEWGGLPGRSRLLTVQQVHIRQCVKLDGQKGTHYGTKCCMVDYMQHYCYCYCAPQAWRRCIMQRSAWSLSLLAITGLSVASLLSDNWELVFCQLQSEVLHSPCKLWHRDSGLVQTCRPAIVTVESDCRMS